MKAPRLQSWWSDRIIAMRRDRRATTLQGAAYLLAISWLSLISAAPRLACTPSWFGLNAAVWAHNSASEVYSDACIQVSAASTAAAVAPAPPPMVS